MLNPTSTTPQEAGDDAKMAELKSDLIKKAQLGLD